MATPVCVGLLVKEEEEEVSVSKISRREKGYRSFVRLSLIAMQLKPIVRLLVWMSESQERCLATSLQRLFSGLDPEVL